MSGLAKKHQKLSRKFISLVFVGCLLFVQIIVPVASVNAIQANPSDQLERWLYYRGMRACFYNPWFGVDVSDDESISASDINNGKLSIKSFEGISTQQKKGFGYLAPGMDGGDDNDGTVNCTDGSIFVRGAKLFGFDNPMKLICAMNRALGSGEGSRIKPSDPIDCERSEKIEFDGGGGDVFQRALTKALESEGSKDRPAFDINNNNGPDYSYKSLLYLIGKRSLEVFCGSNKTIESTGTGSGNVSNKDIVSIDIVKSDGTIDKSKNYPLGNPDRDEDSLVDDIYYDQGGDANNAKDLRCHEMAKMTRDNSADYKTWVKKHPEDAKKNENTAAAAGNSSSSSTDEKTSCAIDGLGWIICPVFNVLAKMVDETYTIVEDMLVVQPLTTTGASQGLYESWQAMRNIANVAFIIAFLVVIYTQITGASQGSGMFSNYGVKKLLPRIILAAILVNSSYWLCAIMIDVSNITGASLRGLLTDSQGSILASPQFSSNFSSDGGGWQGIVGPVLAFSLVGVGSYLALGSIIILLPTVLLAIVTAFLVLTLRQALIIVLVALAPFAFVAYLLPNTQEWFKRWFDLFKTMLLMYPLIAVIFGGSALASHIIMNSRPDSWTIQLMGASVAIIPLAITPVIMKTAGGLLNRFGGIVNNPNRGPIDALRKRAEATAGRIKNNRDIRAVNKTGIGRGSFLRRGRIASEQKREAIQKRRDADVDTFGNTNTGVRGYRAKAIDAQETAQLTGRELENEVKKKHLEANVDLHTRVVDSGLALKHVEDLHRNKATSAYINRNRSQFREGRDAEDELENTKNDAELSYQRSQMGQARASTRQSIEDQLAREKADQKTNYLESADGQVFSVNRKNAEKSAGIADKGTTLAAKQSEQGQQLEQREKGVDDLIQAVDSDAETIYLQSDAGKSARSDAINAKRQATVQGKVVEDIALSSHEGQRISQSEKSADARLKITETDASTAFVQSAVGEALTVSSAVAQGRLGAAEKTTEALMSELKTEKGSQLHPEYTAEAQVLTDTDIQQRVQTQRASAAAGVATVEYAKKITDDTSGLAVTAGGIDKFGEQRAKAAATQTMIDEFNKNVKSEQTTMSKTVSDQYDASGNLLPDAPGPDGQPTLRQIALDPTQSEERRAAAAGMYMKTAPMKDLHSFVDAVGSLPGSNEEEKSVRSSMLMQISEDMSRVPFAYGDTAKTAIRRGDYTTAQYGTHEQQLITRVQRKMSGTEWQSMDPDDRAAIRKLVSTDEGRTALGSVGMSNLQGAFEDINNTPEVRAKTKTDARQEANRVAASLGLNLPFPDTETPPV